MYIVPPPPESDHDRELELAAAKLDAAVKILVDDWWGLTSGLWFDTDSARWEFARLLEASLRHLRRAA